MATQIVISHGEYIKIDDNYHIDWHDKGKNWVDLPSSIHYVIYNTLQGPNEVQTKDPATGNMTGNLPLNDGSDAVGSTTVDELLTWGQTRREQIDLAMTQNDEANTAAYTAHIAGGGSQETFEWTKDWVDYDPNYS